MILKDKNIILCIGGSIACYKAVEVYRRLKKEGASVKIIVSRPASKFISPYIFESFGEEVYTDDAFKKPLAHIELAKNADAILIAPATFNTINKIACGIADTLITLVVSASPAIPKILVPAMNEKMFSNGILKENIDKLARFNFNIVRPVVGELACGEYGEGRFPEINDIIFEVESAFKDKRFKGKRILITAGATREYLDPVRFISNGSSGKMGVSLANEAGKLGADVILIGSNIDFSCHYINKDIKIIKAVSFKDLREALFQEFPKSDILIMTAAVSDFGFKEKSPFKIKKTGLNLKLNLVQNEDLLEAVSHIKKPSQIIFGFAAETRITPGRRSGQTVKIKHPLTVHSDKAGQINSIIENARKKLVEKSLDYIFVNDVSNGIIGEDDSEGFMIKNNGEIRRFEKMKKTDLSEKLFEEMRQRTL